MSRLGSVFALLAFACGLVSQVSAQEEPRAISSIAFGSCLSQNRSQEIWERVRAQNPDLVVLMGDNIYADNVSLPVRRLEYAKVSSNQFFKALRSSSEIVGTWDDHDYGYNDAGKEYIGKHDSQLAFLEFFQVPSDDPRRSRAGVYFSKFFEAQGQALQLIVLDTRYFRDRLIKDAEAQKHGKKPVPYLPNPDPKAQILGGAQWRWLETELAKPAAVRLIVSSIQIIPDQHPFEKWGNFPFERKRLLNLLKSTKGYIMLLSGDRHVGEISNLRGLLPYPLYELTASSFNLPLKAPIEEPNKYRVFERVTSANFGVLRFNQRSGHLSIRASLYDQDGGARNEVELLVP